MKRKYYEEFYYSEKVNDDAKDLIEHIFMKIEQDIEKALYELNEIKGVTEVDYAKKYLEELCDKL